MAEVSGSEKCKNCENAGFSTFRQQAYCAECFPKTCIHMFRASFGKNRLIRDGEKVLVAYSGGPASCAMVQLIKLGLGDGAVRKLRFTPFVFHLDETEFVSSAHPMEDKDAIKEMMNSCGFEYTTLSCREVLSDDSLLSVVAARGEATSRQALHHIVRRRALLEAARRFDCSRVLVGDSGTRLAGLVLESVIQGRGAEVADASAFADTRFWPTIVRPMLEFQESECSALVRLYELPTAAEGRGPLTRSSGMGSLQGLTSRVLHDLQPGFPATNYAVVRTAAKIRETDKTALRCRLCESPVDLMPEAHDGESAVKDLQFSYEFISGQKVMDDKSICYGCHILAKKHPPLQQWLSERR